MLVKQSNLKKAVDKEQIFEGKRIILVSFAIEISFQGKVSRAMSEQCMKEKIIWLQHLP